MKILHFYKTYYPDSVGGTEQVISQLIGAISSLDTQDDDTQFHNIKAEYPTKVIHKVLTLSKNVKGVDVVEVDGHEVIRVPTTIELASTPFSIAAVAKFRELVDWADIVHYHFPYPFADLLHLITKVNKPTLVTYHSDIIKQKQLLKIYRPLQHWFLNKVDKIVATSPNYIATSELLKHYSKHSPDKLSVIPIGLNKDSYPTANADRVEKLKGRFGDKFFLFVGVLRYYKGLHILIEAAKSTEYPIVIVGAGPIEEELQQQSLGMENIHFLGQVTEQDKVDLLTLCYAVVFPSHLRSEAFGISLLEGAMFGKPMISSEIGTGTTFINIDNETGLVVPPSDHTALRNAMDRLWQQPNMAAEMGKDAEARYWQLFTAKQMAISYMKLYHELVTINRCISIGSSHL